MVKRLRIGTYQNIKIPGEGYKAYIPAFLPFKPPLDMAFLQPQLDKASHALGKLEAVVSLLPDISLFLYFFVSKEALFSSQIEGTQSSFDDVLFYENNQISDVPVDDVEEVSHYIAAMQHGLKRIKEGFPLSSRLIKEMHAILLRGGRGSKKQPGEFRASQNWIGGTRPGNAVFVPPPPEHIIEYMGNLERFLNDEFGSIPTLLKAAIAHIQFETIHPFLDGNGRVGRLLITLLLCSEGMLSEPILYLSLFLKKQRKTYYELLTRVREDEQGWEVWVEFFLEGVVHTAEEVFVSANQIVDLFQEDEKRINTLKRAAPNVLRGFTYLQRKALVTIPGLADALEVTQPTATSILKHLVELGIVEEISGNKRHKLFAYQAYLNILRQDTEPL